MQLFRVSVAGALIYASIATIAVTRDTDYSRIKRDISVMA